jgi:hypothetical protein
MMNMAAEIFLLLKELKENDRAMMLMILSYWVLLRRRGESFVQRG